MKLLVFRHNWGMPEKTWAEKLQTAKQAGYDGFETGALDRADYAAFRELLNEQGLEFIPQIFTRGASLRDHIDSFRDQLQAVRQLHPARVNCHSGSDAWSLEDVVRFYGETESIESDAGLQVAHETHRGRCFYNPWTTVRLLERFAALKLCADYSHWVCVCERLLTNEADLLRFCAGRVIHIHARVGFENGPQVSDPRAPEWQAHLEAHELWWRWIVEAQIRLGANALTLTPEFGPPTYMPTLPHTQMPVADLAGIADWQAGRQKRNFALWTAQLQNGETQPKTEGNHPSQP